MKKINLILLGLLISNISFSQDILENDPYKMNNVYERKQHIDKEVANLPYLREADVMWSRKIWREIDLRQKINHPLYYPQDEGEMKTVDRNNLFKVLYNAATEKSEISIRAFQAKADDEFQVQMTAPELMRIVEGTEFTVYWKNVFGEDSLDVNGLRVPRTTDRNNALNQADIKKWRVKELWFFDKQRSVMDVRIIGLCPIASLRDENTGRLNGQMRPICWFYFPEARQALRNTQSFNLVKNEAENKTFEDIFLKRMFSSTIVKEGNVYDREINQYMIGLDALLEAESIKSEIFNIEHDFWEY
jgi:gliding motility associated protien GldN